MHEMSPLLAVECKVGVVARLLCGSLVGGWCMILSHVEYRVPSLAPYKRGTGFRRRLTTSAGRHESHRIPLHTSSPLSFPFDFLWYGEIFVKHHERSIRVLCLLWLERRGVPTIPVRAGWLTAPAAWLLGACVYSLWPRRRCPRKHCSSVPQAQRANGNCVTRSRLVVVERLAEEGVGARAVACVGERCQRWNAEFTRNAGSSNHYT